MPYLHPSLRALILCLGISAAALVRSATCQRLDLRDRTPVAEREYEDASSRQLAGWLAEFGHKGNFLTSSLVEDYSERVGKVAAKTTGRGERALEARLLLLEAAGWKLTEYDAPGVASTIRELAQAELVERLKPGRGNGFFDWLMEEVTPHPDRYGLEVRVVNLFALNARMDMRSSASPEVEQILVALMMSGRDPEPLVRSTALDFLAERTDPFVSDYFLGELERGKIAPETFTDHLRRLEANSSQASKTWWERRGARVQTYVRSGLEAEDWRRTSMALAVAPELETASIVPFLIQGLGVWDARTRVGGRLRVISEYAEALGRLTGLDYGMRADTWARWWQAETADGTYPATPTTEERATFFGLAPRSDRVLFIIDRSGSMRQSYQSSPSRYAAAVEALVYTLRDLGPDARFQVVLFAMQAERFRPDLTRATPENLELLEDWATRRGVGGGTDLRAGFDAAFPGLESGEMAATDIPFDSVYVLCDGETGSPAWVAPWLLEHNVQARLTFHCVNLGGTPAGALEALATGSGGAFVRHE